MCVCVQKYAGMFSADKFEVRDSFGTKTSSPVTPERPSSNLQYHQTLLASCHIGRIPDQDVTVLYYFLSYLQILSVSSVI